MSLHVKTEKPFYFRESSPRDHLRNTRAIQGTVPYTTMQSENPFKLSQAAGLGGAKKPLVRDSSINSLVDVQTHDSNMDSLDLAVYDCESSDDES